MDILKKLLKNEFLGLLSMNNLFDARKGKLKKPVLLITGAIIFIISLLVLSVMYSYLLAYSLITVNAVELLPTLMLAAGSIVVFFYCSLRSSSILFKSSDYDMLMSLPIPDKTLILSKVIYLYISDLGFSLIFMLPSFMFWWYFTSPSILVIIMTFIALPFIPMLPIAAATIVGTAASFLSGRSRYKSLISTLANLIFALGIIFASMTLSQRNPGSADMGNIISMLLSNITAQYPPAILFYNITQGNILSFFAFILVSIAVSALFVFIISNKFKGIRSSLVNVSIKASTKKLTYTNSGVFISLLKKELLRFLSSSVYLLNCGIGLILGVGGVVYVVFFQSDLIALVNDTPVLYNMLIPLLPLAAGILTTTTTSSGVSLSLEGYSLWVAKHIPVSAYHIFLSKIVFQILLTAPVALLISITSIALFNIKGIYIIFILVFPFVFSIFAAYLGMLLNISFPNFTWTSEAKVVKQSAPVALSLFLGFAFIGITYILISMVLGADTAPLLYMVEIILFVIFSIASDMHLRKNSEMILKRL